MLVSVVMVFIVCQVPALIYNMAYAISMATVTTSSAWNVLSTLRNFLVNLNSAINFILYCALGQKFRRTFVRTFCPCVARRARDGFHSFTSAHHGDLVNSNSHNGAVYMKLMKGGKGKKGGGAGGRGVKAGALPRQQQQHQQQQQQQQQQQNGSKKNSKTDLTKVADQDSGVVVHKYSSPCASVDSSNCDAGSIYLASSGRGKVKSRVSERSLLPKSRDDV